MLVVSPTSAEWGCGVGEVTRHLPLLPPTDKKMADAQEVKKPKCLESQAKYRRPAASVAVTKAPWPKPFPGCAAGSSSEPSAEDGMGLCIFAVRSWARRAGDCTQESCGTAGNRSQVLTMPVRPNRKNIFLLSFKVTCTTKPSAAFLINLPFYHLRCSFDRKFGKTELALRATKWCSISVFLSSSRDMRKILSKDFSLSHVLLLAP